MRWKLPLVVLLVSLFGIAAAQRNVDHEARVEIPTVLKLRIDHAQQRDRVEVPIRIEVRDGAYQIDPAATSIEIFANAGWQLAVSYRPASATDADARLLWRSDDANNGAWRAFHNYEEVVMAGGPTGGWQRTTFHYGLDTPLPADGVYQGVVTYTLARP